MTKCKNKNTVYNLLLYFWAKITADKLLPFAFLYLVSISLSSLLSSKKKLPRYLNSDTCCALLCFFFFFLCTFIGSGD